MAKAFVYCWTDHKTNKLYIGSHKGQINDGYICSSKTMLEEYNKRPLDFTRQIVAEGESNDMRKFEHVLLKTINAATNEAYYNKHNGFGSYLTDEIKQKIGQASKKLWKDDDFRKKMSEFHKNRWKLMGPEKKEYIRKTVSMKQRGKPKSEEHKKKCRGKRPHVNQKYSNNNNAVAIETPYGFFGSIREAADVLNIKYDTVYYKLNTNKPGWRKLV